MWLPISAVHMSQGQQYEELARESNKNSLQPVTRSPGSYQPLKLVDLHPDQLIHPSIAPHGKQLPSQLHRSSSDP